jgi:hypothetical protein
MPCSGEGLEPARRAEAEVLLGRRLVSVAKVGGGLNSRVYRVSDGRASYALKLYPRETADPRDRLGAEVTALRFLHSHGCRDVPDVVAADRERRIGIYEWIDGSPIAQPGKADIAAALELLATLHRLRNAEPAAAFPLAAEACLSARELVAQIERRQARLADPALGQPVLAEFLAEGVTPALARAQARAERAFAASGLAFAAELPVARRSLSPSDFGFHNAIRRPDGRIVFCDFEYFGWDDPAKPVADFLLHPAMTIPPPLKRAFVAGALSLYGADDTYGLRLRALLPLYGLRWCLILLNEFLPERWARRLEAGTVAPREAVLAAQLVKAKGMLEIADASIESFPYGD